MNKKLFLSNTQLKKIIQFKKMGITIRQLTDEENKLLITNYKKIILNKKNRELAKKYQDIRNNKDNYDRTEVENTYLSLISLEKTDKFKYDVIFELYLDIVENAFEKITLKNINKYLKKIIVVELNKEEFEKQFEERYISLLIPKIIDFCNYINTFDGNIKKFDSFLFDFDMLGNPDNKYHTKSLGLLLNEDTRQNLFSHDNLEKLEVMLNNNNSTFNFNFMMIIDSMFEETGLIENQIINKVSFLERLLIGKTNNKQEQFVLKIGVLCNDLVEIPSEILKERLKEIYDVRSILVHGNPDKIIDNIEKYKNVFGEVIKKGKNKNETKLNILTVIDTYLEFYFIEVLKKYLENYKLCEYMKIN